MTMNHVETEVKFKLPRGVVDFIDSLCSLGGSTREGWLRETIRANLSAALERDLAPTENPLDAYRDVNALLSRALAELRVTGRAYINPLRGRYHCERSQFGQQSTRRSVVGINGWKQCLQFSIMS